MCLIYLQTQVTRETQILKDIFLALFNKPKALLLLAISILP